MERGPLALFGAVVAVGLGPAMWLGAQFGESTLTPQRPPAVTVKQNDVLVPQGGTGAGDLPDDPARIVDAGAGAGDPQRELPRYEAPETLPTSSSPAPSSTSEIPAPPSSSPTGTPPPTESSSEPSTPPTESATEPGPEPSGDDSPAEPTPEDPPVIDPSVGEDTPIGS